jgi:CheY-like chemotaxis protein
LTAVLSSRGTVDRSERSGSVAAAAFAKRVRIIHWRAEEAQTLVEAIRASGFEPEYTGEKEGGALTRAIRANPPDLIVIDLSRLPSHGRELGIWVRSVKALRRIPLVFVNGEDEKRERVRADLPDAVFADTRRIRAALKLALRAAPEEPVSPPPMMERYRGRTTAQKLGIAPGSRVAVIEPPRNYASALGPLPENVELIEDSSAAAALTVWFIDSEPALANALPRMRAIAAISKLWVAWRKGQKKQISENQIREAAIGAGLVDYKVCSLNEEWSALALARRKS